MNQSHPPDPEFVSNLEWQIRTALRREQRFAQPIQSRSIRTVKIATLVMLSVLFGAGGVVVKDEVQEARQQEILLAEVRGNIRVATMEMELIRTQFGEVQERFEGGLVQEDALLGARLALLRAENRLTRLRMDEEEIRVTGRAPQDRLSAPLVAGRDLVSRRLELELEMATEESKLARMQMSRIQDLYESGQVDEAQLVDALVPIQQAESHVETLEQRLELRRGVLDGTISGPAAERRIELIQVQGELKLLNRVWESAAEHLQQVRERVDQGLLEESELRAAELRLLELETRREILRMKEDILREDVSYD